MRQYEKLHATSIKATAALVANRFVGYNGAHASAAAGGGADSQGITETACAIGQEVAVVTGYSYLVEASTSITALAFVKPAADGTGRAAVGSKTDHCGRALRGGSAGQLIEVVILKHVHP